MSKNVDSNECWQQFMTWAVNPLYIRGDVTIGKIRTITKFGWAHMIKGW